MEIHVWGLWITIAEGQFFPTKKKMRIKIREQSEIIFYEEVILMICKIFSNFAEKFARYDPKSQISERRLLGTEISEDSFRIFIDL